MSAAQIFIQSYKKRFAVYIDIKDPVDKIKSIIEEKAKIPIQQQRLLYGGKELTNMPLSHYNVGNGSILILSVRAAGARYSICLTKNEPATREIFIQTAVKQFRVTFDIKSTALELKSYIQQTQGIQIAHQRLCHAGKQLTDNMSLLHSDIDNGAVIQLILRPWSVRGGGPMQMFSYLLSLFVIPQFYKIKFANSNVKLQCVQNIKWQIHNYGLQTNCN